MKNHSDIAAKKYRNYAWRSLLCGFSLIPIIFLAGPLMALFPKENDTHIYVGLLLGLLAILLQIVGLVLGVIGLVRVRGPEKIFCGIGAAVCIIFCLIVIDKLFK